VLALAGTCWKAPFGSHNRSVGSSIFPRPTTMMQVASTLGSGTWHLDTLLCSLQVVIAHNDLLTLGK